MYISLFFVFYLIDKPLKSFHPPFTQQTFDKILRNPDCCLRYVMLLFGVNLLSNYVIIIIMLITLISDVTLSSTLLNNHRVTGDP